MYPYKAIAAVAENGVIGMKNKIPWHLPEDFKWFKQTTMGGILVMGRKTFESIGRPLPGRETIVLSRSSMPVRTASSLNELKQMVSDDPRTVWICGGAEVYRQILPECSDLYLTRVHMSPEGDTDFPPFSLLFNREEDILATTEFTVQHWVRKKEA